MSAAHRLTLVERQGSRSTDDQVVVGGRVRRNVTVWGSCFERNGVDYIKRDRRSIAGFWVWRVGVVDVPLTALPGFCLIC